jgi:hypothetical protein
MKSKRKIAIIALGKPHAGKSTTWYEIFGRTIRSGVKQLDLDGRNLTVRVKNASFEESDDEIETYFAVLVINASNEESGKKIEDYLDVNDLPWIVFCSVQYIKDGLMTIDWFWEHGYYLYIQWINPGYHDERPYDDFLELEKRYGSSGKFKRRSGKEKKERAAAIVEFLRAWVNDIKASG